MTPSISPRRVVATTGNVVFSRNEGPISFVLSNDESNHQSDIVLDYGRAEKGVPVFQITNSTSTSPKLSFRTSYSESLKEIHHENGDGPYFLFSNAMDTYRAVTHSVATSTASQIVTARHAQCSQRYQKVVLLTPNASITFKQIGFQSIRPEAKPLGSFRCSDERLNRIWKQGVRTVDMCTVQPDETLPAWDVTSEGTRIYGQHWAPCRQGTRWLDKSARFQVKIEEGGASWGIHMVANGLVWCLDKQNATLTASEGLSHESSVFPSIVRGSWIVNSDLLQAEWLTIDTVAQGDSVTVTVNDVQIGTVSELNLHPLLGGAENNSGSIAFGGPAGWSGLYRNLSVTDVEGRQLYHNTLLPVDRERTFADFAVGSNPLACLIDGAKRDRAVFGGDLHITGRSASYSTADFAAIRGSIKLLMSHQTKDGFLGNLCPIQAPQHSEDEEPPTYAFYSLTYALALVVALKDYWLFSGDDSIVRGSWEQLLKLVQFAERFTNDKGLIAAPPPLSLTFFPLAGPVFGASTEINLALYDTLQSMATMSSDEAEATTLRGKAANLKSAIVRHLWSSETGILRMSDTSPPTGICTHVNAYGISLGVSPRHPDEEDNLIQPDSKLLPAFKGLDKRWDSAALCSPYGAAFAAEACFKLGSGHAAVDLVNRVWGSMIDEAHQNYSGGLWEAMTLEGDPVHKDTSLMHAWSSGPVYLLPMYLAGLRPTKSGWKEWEAAPVSAGLKDVEASVQTPVGQIKVQWVFDMDSDGCGTVHVESPEGTVGKVSPPKGWLIGRGDWTCGYSGDGLRADPGATRFLLKKETVV